VGTEGSHRLHTLTASPGWHLLICGTEPPHQPADLLRMGRGHLWLHHLDAVAHQPALAALRLAPDRPGLLLIRPDGHIALRTTGSDTTGLLSYLNHWLPQPGTSL